MGDAFSHLKELVLKKFPKLSGGLCSPETIEAVEISKCHVNRVAREAMLCIPSENVLEPCIYEVHPIRLLPNA